jgi:branched-chain amino acid transport system substrate-binding protein
MQKKSWLNLILSMFLILTACQSTPTAEIPPSEQNPSSSPSSQPEPVAPDPTTIPQQSDSGKSIAIFEALETDRGREALEWARMAVEDLNATSSMKMTLVEVDTGGSPATVATGANELAGNRDVLAVVGLGLAGEAISAIAVLDIAGLPVITSSGYAQLTQQGYQNLFRIVPIDDGQGSAAGRFIVETLNASNVYLLSQRSNSGPYFEILNTSLEQAVSASGGSIVGRNEITPDTMDLGMLASEIQSAGAEVVFMGSGSPEQVVELSKTLQGAASIVAHYGAANSTLLGTEGVFVLSRAPAIPSEILRRFQNRQSDYSTDGALVYTATMTALEAIQRALEAGNSNSGAVRDELAKLDQQLDLLEIPIAFDANGDLRDAQFYVLQVENGEFKTVWP